jgi:hypothetical protein
MNQKTLLAVVGVVCLVIGAGAGYFGRPLLNRTPARGQFAARQGGGAVIGTVQSIADDRLTVQTPNGGSQIVLTSNNTTYQHVVSGSASDVATGATVMIRGQQNPDGSTTAASVQVLPAGTNFGNRGTQPSATPE